MTEEKRKCYSCNETKPLTPEFWAWKDKTHSSFRTKCRKCTNYDSKISHRINRTNIKEDPEETMEKINERLYQANIDLVDRNRLLEEDKTILKKRIKDAIEILNDNTIEAGKACRISIDILKGRYVKND